MHHLPDRPGATAARALGIGIYSRAPLPPYPPTPYRSTRMTPRGSPLSPNPHVPPPPLRTAAAPPNVPAEQHAPGRLTPAGALVTFSLRSTTRSHKASLVYHHVLLPRILF